MEEKKNGEKIDCRARRSLRVRRQEIAGPSSERRGSAREGARKRSTPGPVVVLSAGGGGGGGGVGGCRRRDLERRGGGGRGAPCLATISSSVAGSAGGCGPVVGLPSYKKRQGIFFNAKSKRIDLVFT